MRDERTTGEENLPRGDAPKLGKNSGALVDVTLSQGAADGCGEAYSGAGSLGAGDDEIIPPRDESSNKRFTPDPSEDFLSRTRALLGEEATARLRAAHIAVIGLGGVGGIAAEALARSGAGELTLIDGDVVSPSNLNRQIFATRETVGSDKIDAARARLLSIHPALILHCRKIFLLPDNIGQIDFSAFDYVIDALDTVAAKIAIALRAREAGVPLLSCMGTGNKLDPTQLRVGDLDKTSVCPLARVLRRELGRRGIRHLKVVYSTEEPRNVVAGDTPAGRHAPGSMMFVPAAAGLLLAAQAVKDLTAGA